MNRRIRQTPRRRTLTRRRRSRNRSGVAMVEFAIVLPLFVTIALGCVDFGRFVHAQIAVHNAAREGAGSVINKNIGPSATPSPSLMNNINIAVQREMSDIARRESPDGAFPPGYALNVTLPAEGAFRRVRVTVTYPFNTIVPWPAIPSTLDLTHSIEMRLLE